MLPSERIEEKIEYTKILLNGWNDSEKSELRTKIIKNLKREINAMERILKKLRSRCLRKEK